jgi:hypothetical protein
MGLSSESGGSLPVRVRSDEKGNPLARNGEMFITVSGIGCSRDCQKGSSVKEDRSLLPGDHGRVDQQRDKHRKNLLNRVAVVNWYS